MRTRLWAVWVLSLVIQACIVTYYFTTEPRENTNYFTNIIMVITFTAALMNILHYAHMKYKKVFFSLVGLMQSDSKAEISACFPKDDSNEEITARVISQNKNLAIGGNLYTAGFWSLHIETSAKKGLSDIELLRIQS
jgi:hypothetical protein